jgi:transglutaminase-like putative cysteine protease
MKMNVDGFLLTLALAWICPTPVARSETGKHFDGPYHITITPSQRVRATVKSIVRFPNLTAREWWAVLPLPPEFEGQPAARGRAQIAGAPLAAVGYITDESALSQPLTLLHWYPDNIDGAQNVIAEAIYDVTITRRTLEPGEPIQPVPRLKPVERSTFLAPTSHFDFSSRAFQAWLRKNDLRRKSGERDLDFAYRAMETLVRTHTYRYVPTSDRSASAVCAAGWSDCGGLSTIYVCILRANGIPARCLTGRTIRPNGTHVKMDFYAERIGWVPGDPAVAIGSHLAEAGLGQEHFDMVVTHFDMLRINDRYQWLQGIGVIRPVRAQGNGTGRTFEHEMVVEVLSADDRTAAATSRSAESKARKRAATRRN